MDTLCYSPADGYHIVIVHLLLHTHDFLVSSLSFKENEPILCISPNIPAKLCKTFDHLIPNPDTSIPGHAAATTTSIGPASSKTTYTLLWADGASLKSETLFEKTPYIGFGICISGTCAFLDCHKVPTPAKNITEAELNAGSQK
jgi:hypothetical protein